MTVPRVVERLRQPEYIGENRCLPCTAVNVTIAVALAIAVVVTLRLPFGVGPASAVAALLLVGSLVTIALRGYLVPGTPTLTKRYLPDRVLAHFDKLDDPDPTPEPDEIDAETLLLEADVIEPCEHEDDLCLSPSFERALDERRGEIDVDTDPSRIAAALGVDGDPSIERHGTAFAMSVDGTWIGQWESEAALLADLIAADALAEHYPDWTDLHEVERGQLLGSLRLFVETCPACGGPVALAEETVTSCCRSIEVAAVRCEGCEDRLLEVQL